MTEHLPPEHADHVDHLNAAVVTVLCKATSDDGRPVVVVVGPPEDGITRVDELLVPRFWSDQTIVSSAQNVLTRKVRHPVFWLLGSFEGGRTIGSHRSEVPGYRNELDRLTDMGLLEPEVRDKLRSYKYGHVPVIVRTPAIAKAFLPGTQGFGHFEGARIAVFERSEEPLGQFQSWLDYTRSIGKYSPPQMLTSDFAAPVGCRAWMCPYGEENREHATLAAAGSAHEIAERLANDLDIPLLTVPCSTAEWEAWDWDQTPPNALSEVLKPLSPNARQATTDLPSAKDGAG